MTAGIWLLAPREPIIMTNRHIGPSFDEFLAAEGILEEAEAVAKKRLKTVNDVFIELWTLRSSGDPYGKKEKRLWMLLQRFVESKGARKASAKDYD